MFKYIIIDCEWWKHYLVNLICKLSDFVDFSHKFLRYYNIADSIHQLPDSSHITNGIRPYNGMGYQDKEIVY